MNKEIEKIKETRRWVIKIGSALITDNGCGLKHDVLDSWVGQISTLTERGIDIVIVSSGAVAEGLTRLGWKDRPKIVSKLQAAAAVGGTSHHLHVHWRCRDGAVMPHVI